MTLVASATGFVGFSLVARLTQEGIEKRARVSIRRRPSRRVCGARGTVYTPVSASALPSVCDRMPARLVAVSVWAVQGSRDLFRRLCGNLQVGIFKARGLLDRVPTVSSGGGLRRAIAEIQKS